VYPLNASVYLNKSFEDLGERNNIRDHSKAFASSFHDHIQNDLI